MKTRSIKIGDKRSVKETDINVKCPDADIKNFCRRTTSEGGPPLRC